MLTNNTSVDRTPRFLAGSPDSLRLTWKSAALIVLFGISLLSINLGGNRVLTYHEVVFAEPAKEMLATGDWIIPRIGGVPFLDKPPVPAWLIATSMTLFGSEAEWVVRFPSVVSACLTALMIAAMGARWFGQRIGLIAGLVQLTSYYMLQLARLGECDIQLITAVCGAMCSFALASVDSPHGRSTARWLPWTFYLGAGLAFLIKGPRGPGFIFAGCLLFLLINQDARGLRFFFNPLGLAIFALCLLPYPLVAYARHPPFWDAWLLHNFGRFKGDMGGHKPMFYYFYHLPLVLLPWFPFVAWTLVRGLRQGLHVEPLWRFAVCWLTPGFTVLSLASFQSKHYLAPLLPAMSIAAAVGLVEYFHWRQRRPYPLWAFWSILTIVSCIAGVVVVQRLQPAASMAISGMIALLGAGLLAIIAMERQRNIPAQLAMVFTLAWLMVAGVHSYVMPHHDTYRDQTILAGRINAALSDDQRVYMLGLPDCQITYYLQQPVTRIDDHREFLARLPAMPGTAVHALAPEWIAEELAQAGKTTVLDRCDSITRWMKPRDRLTLIELCHPSMETATKTSELRR